MTANLPEHSDTAQGVSEVLATVSGLRRWLNTHGGGVDEFDVDGMTELAEAITEHVAAARRSAVEDVVRRGIALADEWEAWSNEPIGPTENVASREVINHAAYRLRAVLSDAAAEEA